MINGTYRKPTCHSAVVTARLERNRAQASARKWRFFAFVAATLFVLGLFR